MKTISPTMTHGRARWKLIPDCSLWMYTVSLLMPSAVKYHHTVTCMHI
jgi:hypothetical protein